MSRNKITRALAENLLSFKLMDGQYGIDIVSNSRLKILMQMEENPAKIVIEVFGLSNEEMAKRARIFRASFFYLY